jgi:hypothetical protein
MAQVDPFAILRAAYAALQQISVSLEEAAENLGCTGARKFRRITLPLIMPGLFAGGTLVFIWSFTELGTPLMLNYERCAPVQIYDALGAEHLATVTYTNTGPGAWGYDISVDGADVTGGTPGTPSSIGTGNVTFGPTGLLTAPAADVAFDLPGLAETLTALRNLKFARERGAGAAR